MAKIRIISRAEAQQTRRPKALGVRGLRMREMDTYVRALLDSPDDALILEDLGEPAQQFVLSLRGAFNRAGVAAVVRKMRAKDEIRAWLVEADEDADVPVVTTRRARERELVPA